MDERLHSRVDELSDEALEYLYPIMELVLTIENERHKGLIASSMIAVFLSPDQTDFDRVVSRFGRVGIEPSEITVLAARTYIESEELRMMAENGEIVLALADRQEIIERQRERIEEIDATIERLQAQSADLQAQSADLQAQSADLQAQITRLLAMREDIILIIEEIEAAANTST